MKKRTAFIGAILSLIPLGHPFFMKTGLSLSTTGLMLSLSEKVNAKSADFYFDRAYYKAEKGDYYGAISDFTKAIEIDPNYKEAYYNRGWNKYKLNDYYGAISDYTKAIEIDPNFALAYSNRAVTKGEGFKDDEGACSDIKKAASLGDKYRIDWLETSEGKWCKDM